MEGVDFGYIRVFSWKEHFLPSPTNAAASCTLASGSDEHGPGCGETAMVRILLPELSQTETYHSTHRQRGLLNHRDLEMDQGTTGQPAALTRFATTIYYGPHKCTTEQQHPPQCRLSCSRTVTLKLASHVSAALPTCLQHLHLPECWHSVPREQARQLALRGVFAKCSSKDKSPLLNT